jgi:hypothetical protein
MKKNKWDFSVRTVAFLAFANYFFAITNTYYFIKNIMAGDLLFIADALITPVGFIAGTMAVISMGKKMRYIK